MSKATADCAMVADRGMRDRMRQQWGTRNYFRGLQEIDMARQRANGESVLLTTIPRSSANSPISTISSEDIRRRFIAGIRLWPPDKTLALSSCGAGNSGACATLVARA